MTVFSNSSIPNSQRYAALARKFIRWVTSPHVVLSLIMLVVMFYMVIIPLYRMLMTTITVQESDLRVLKDAKSGILPGITG